MDAARALDSHCRLCGRDAGLTFEHLPPKAAFEANPARVFGLDAWLGRGGDAGPHTLCDDCIDLAARRHLPELERWRRAAGELIDSGPRDAELDADSAPTWSTAELYDVRPARFIRQALTMLLAITPAGFGPGEHAALADFVLDARRRGLPRRYQLYLALYRGPFTRFVGYSAQLDAATRRSSELVELAHPPFSFVLSLAGDADIETTNITGFAELGIDEACIVDLDLLNGFGHTPYPADFRTQAALARDREAERRVA